MYKLGAQGLALQKQLQQRKQIEKVTVFPDFTSQQQQEIESFIQLLKSNNPTIDKKQLLSYCINYFPKIRNVDNLRLITALFFKNTILFPLENHVNFETESIIIDAIQYLIQTKLRISEPCISKEKFLEIFLHELYDNKKIQPIQKISVLTGIILSKPISELIITPETKRFYLDSYNSVGCLIVELVTDISQTIQGIDCAMIVVYCTSLTLSCCSSSSSQIFKSLPHEILFQLSMDIFLSNDLPKPLWDNFHKLSFLIETNIMSNNIPYPILKEQLDRLYQFSQKLNQQQQQQQNITNIMKNYYFGIISIFQGFVKLNLNAYCKLNSLQIFTNFMQILTVLNELHFVLIKLGTSGFKAYDFVLLNCINGGLELNQSEFEQMVHLMHHENIINGQSEKIIFSLTLFEYLTKYCSFEYFQATILPTLEKYLKLKHTDGILNKLLLESTHQVIISNLSHFHLNQNAYLKIVINQYQLQLLKINQLQIITRQLTNKAKSTELLNNLLHTIYLAILNTKLYPSHIDEEIEIDQYPKIGLLKSLICSIPSIHNIISLQNWLETISELIDPLPLNFKNPLNDFIWTIISNELTVRQLDIAIEWWYGRGSLRSTVTAARF